MGDCDQYVISIYNNKDINSLISKIKPTDLQDDLKQEIALSLLTMPCEKVAALFLKDNLVRYSIKICWILATSKNVDFYKKYKKNDLVKAVEYMSHITSSKAIPESVAVDALNILKNKNKDIYDDHEARIFNKYVELGSGRAVARYYNIPANHVCNIISKVKKELKCMLLQ